MAKEVRKRMVDGAVHLLARRGLDATSFPEVLALTGASRGSVYHHFPGGKDELVAAALDVSGGYLIDALEQMAGAPANEVTRGFLELWRRLLVQSKFEAGCAVVAVTVAAGTPQLLDRAAAVFRAWRALLAALLERGGLSTETAARFAATLIAATEGAVILSRAEQDIAPFELVAAQLQDDIERLMAERPPLAHPRRLRR